MAKNFKALEVLAVHFGENNYEENFIIAIEVYLNIDIYEYNHVCLHTTLFRKIIYTLVQLEAVSASLDPLYDFISAFMFLL